MKALEGNLAKILKSTSKGREALRKKILTEDDVLVTINGKVFRISSRRNNIVQD